MNSVFQQNLKWLSKQPAKSLNFQRGLEKEGLRVQKDGMIAQSDHPESLGSALTHASITTDYSEALLEFITPVKPKPEDNLSDLTNLHHYTLKNLSDELIWPGSMPSVIDGEESIRIAEYGSSNIGQLKHVYRHGLWHRYGRIMQSIAGLHFNFSFNQQFWIEFQKHIGDTTNGTDFMSNQYLGLIRNFRRYSWLLMYLYGASPATDKSFFPKGNNCLKEMNNSFVSEYATSLRMSDVGYTNKAQDDLYVCFNSLDGYIDNLQQAIKSHYPPYKSIGIKNDQGVYKQMNTNILQIENEYYSDIRPKRVTRSGEKPVCALAARGVEYIEVRCLDLNPFEPLGISEAQIYFLDVFLMWCLISDSPTLSDEECSRLRRNLNTVVSFGRKPDLQLEGENKPFHMLNTAKNLFQELKQVGEVMTGLTQDNKYISCFDHVHERLEDPTTLPSQKIYDAINQGMSYKDLMLEWAKKHKSSLLSEMLNNNHQAALVQEAQKSLLRQKEIEASDSISFDEFLANYQKQKPE